MQDTEQKIEQTPKTGSAMKHTDLVFVDIETTGLDARTNEIIEIAVVRVRQDWQDGQPPSFTLVSEWSEKIMPERMDLADPASLRVSGFNATDWKGAKTVDVVLKRFAEHVDGAIMVAHNVAFDYEFISHKLAQCGIPNPMHYHRLDTVSMAFAVLHSTPDASRYSLAELCKYFGIINEHPHSALADARADFELFKKLVHQ